MNLILVKLDFLYYVIPAIVIVCLLVSILFFKLRQKPGQITYDVQPFIEGLGGLENIEHISATLSRLQLQLKDPTLINQEKLKQLGAHSIIVMSKKVIILIGDQAQLICEQIKLLLKE